jgi:hypothetical protein
MFDMALLIGLYGRGGGGGVARRTWEFLGLVVDEDKRSISTFFRDFLEILDEDERAISMFFRAARRVSTS